MNMINPLLTEHVRRIHHERDEKAASQRHDPRESNYAKKIHRERSLRFARAKALGDLSQSPGSATSALNVGSLSTRTSQAVRAYWWVPAGFAVMVLLRSIMGG
jgi:hypothetical protein